MKSTSFARVRGYLPRLDGGLLLVYCTGTLSALLWPPMVVVLSTLVQLLTAGVNVEEESGLGVLPWMVTNVSRDPERCLLVLLLVGLGLASLECLLLFFLDRLVKRTAQRATTRLRSELRRQAFHLAGSELFGARETSLAELFTDRMELVRQGLVAWWNAVPREIMRLGLLVGVALIMNAWLTLAALLLASLVWLMLVWLFDRWKHQKALLDDRANISRSLLLEGLQQVRLVRGYMLDDTPGQPFEESLEHYHNAALARHQSESSLEPLVRFVVLCGAGLILGLLGLNLLRYPPRITVDQAAILYAALFCAYQPLTRVMRLPSIIERADRAAAEVFHYLDREPGVGQTPDATPLDSMRKQVDLAGVTLLDGSGHKLLDEITLQIPAGSRVAVVSLDQRAPYALAYLLPRFYDPFVGRVQFDGKDTRYCTLASLRSQAALVMQEGLLFTGSVSENIGCGDPKFSPLQVSEAAKRARAYDFVQRLPQGFNTVVGEHGMRLNNSQQVRIGLARALLRDPTLVILEEPPDEMDEPTAELFDQAVSEIAGGRTLIVLPSRLVTLRNVERVYLLHEGKLIDQGTHADMLKSSDLYRHLIYLKFNAFRDGAK